MVHPAVMASTDKLIVLITGANQGIGLATAKHFGSSGEYFVYIGSRSLANGEEAVEELVSQGIDKDSVQAAQLDVTEDESIDAAVATVEREKGRLDILINNAGILDASSAPNSPLSIRATYQYVYNTNVFGPVVMTNAFLPLLRKSSAPEGKRIIMVSSALGHYFMATDHGSPWAGKIYPEYRSSKTALNMMMVHFGDLLMDEGFVVAGVCPGVVATAGNGYMGDRSAEEGSRIIFEVARRPGEEVHEKVSSVSHGVYPW